MFLPPGLMFMPAVRRIEWLQAGKGDRLTGECIINSTAADLDFITKEENDEIQAILALCFLRRFPDREHGLLVCR
jgi:hypothetical protein